VDAYLALTSKRDEREYAERPIPEDVVRRILDAGRIAGSANNLQPWRFLILEDRDLLERVAETVYVPGNLLGARMVVAIVVRGGGPVAFDAGRAAQNMMLAAWNEGVVSCPHGMPDPERTAELLGLDADERPLIVLSFGYPARPRDPGARPPEEWIRRAERKPLEEVARHL
jgi:nitroreductase